MATYKVPQDVEAEDKLLGPFSFRQFIYLMIAVGGGFLAFGLSRIFMGLLVIPLPFIAFFVILALPLRKDQPMETYLAAIVRFWLKPRVRLWSPEGNTNLVEIVAPKVDGRPITKDFTGDEAAYRLSYLSQVVDTRGWASRGLTSAVDGMQLSDTLVAEAQSAEDMLDENANVSQNFDSMISQTNSAYKQTVRSNMQASLQTSQTQQPTPAPPPATQAPPPATPTQAYSVVPAPTTTSTAPVAVAVPTEPVSSPTFNPYPSAMHQRVISPANQPVTVPTPTVQPIVPEKAQAPSPEAVSPDIIRLATNKDLSISTLAREAKRLQDKENEEVVVSLR